MREEGQNDFTEYRKIYSRENKSSRITGLTVGRKYDFKVSASNSCGVSPGSEPIQVKLEEESQCHHGNCGPDTAPACHVDVNQRKFAVWSKRPTPCPADLGAVTDNAWKADKP